jgi:hypothetical protein
MNHADRHHGTGSGRASDRGARGFILLTNTTAPVLSAPPVEEHAA